VEPDDECRRVAGAVAADKPPVVPALYMLLIGAFPLRRLRNDHELDEAVEVIDRLIDRGDLTASKQAYVDALGVLVEAYEREHVVLPEVSGVELLRHLMDVHDLKQADLVAIFGTKSIASEVLSGKRRLTFRHIQGLSALRIGGRCVSCRPLGR
jgi:HTH-type transcriptional regulator/antitoxin HigA